ELPGVKIAVAHGQMGREEIENVMYSYINREYDILVCTTIIETGIDIANANTIIIDRADTFGLSQLYQIRGRVGRSERIAYCYLMYNPQKQLSEVAVKRLQAIKDFTELGSGYKIAMRDLTIRGAGDLLGEKQAGFINTVGMDMYLDMLHEAIREKKGLAREEPHPEIARVNNVEGYIPENFAPQDYEKIELYQRIDKTATIRQLQTLEEEISDRYGKLPGAVKLLFEKRRMELMLASDRFESFDELARECRLTLSPQFSQSLDGVKLFERIIRLSGDIKLKYTQGRIILSFVKKKNWFDTVTKAMAIIEELD
ncbi:MAG: transcription-repair coupling factor, partial [Erysipelotrichaceae bacterium]|nr:transcription-repair coupling factor [Erysipelotrichaceae bacterium]